MRITHTTLALALLGACGGPNAAGPTTTHELGTTPPSQLPSSSRESTARRWENPGGMWMPRQLTAHVDTLKQLGFALDPTGLGDVGKAPLGAIVNIGGCSASFVSPDGLIATNHHCIQGILQHSSTPEDNIIKNGYLAKSRADERWGGPTQRVYVELGATDVTAEMTAGLDGIEDDLERKRALEKREKAVLAACEAQQAHTRCTVASFFGGGEWQAIRRLEIRDLRLVYAPPASVGNYGGEIDNWQWPRHSGDFAFLRAYVGPDGQPADHSADNVAYKPKHHLALASSPLADGDFVLVAGYPGKTSRLAPSWEVEEARTWRYPRTIASYEQQLALIEAVAKDQPALAIKANSKKRRVANYMKKHKGELATLEGGLAAERGKLDEELFAWVAADEQRKARYAPALEAWKQAFASKVARRDADALVDDLVWGSGLLDAALMIVRVADERGLADGERSLGFQARDYRMLEQKLVALDKSYARELDRAFLKFFVERALAAPVEQQPAGLVAALGLDNPNKKKDGKAVDAAIERLYKSTRLESSAARTELFRTASKASLARSKDPFIKLALALYPAVNAQKDAARRYAGAAQLAAPLYVEAMRELRGGTFAPDANSTLRVTFGTVMASPKGGRAFTTTSELAAKATAEPPFDAPERILDAVKAKHYGPHAAAELGEAPVDFMSDLDITNGNSGSATLNAKGELVGLAFDGTLDSVASDWLYMKGVTRTIHVDLRYMLWVVEILGGDAADPLLRELGVEPRL